METTIDGPFGKASHVLSLPTDDVVVSYRRKCGADVARWFGELHEIHLFECNETGYRFWRPASIVGDEQFYKYLGGLKRDYYHAERWEYPFVRSLLAQSDSVIEVGCGRGFFLRGIEDRVAEAIGVEFNREAIAAKATRFDVINTSIERVAESKSESFSVVCSFQVLEHVVDPHSFLAACVRCLRPGGVLALATPNYGSAMLANREDAFDLPPHHMGHFSEAVYRRVAPRYGLDVERIHVEKRYFELNDTVTAATRTRFLYRVARRLSSTMMSFAYGAAREPGNNILAILRKR
ncbi:MAG: methyltransferase domain-containing protein [Alphaproteobacteria bacterium]|nr:methyltransferase domain-containing protein [Alphaproteobacteria bacterium]